MLDYKMIKSFCFDEITIEKSRFIGYANPCTSKEEAEEFLSKIRKKHYDATHNCWAYVIGDDFSTLKCSDDGEPSGTAGVPILEVLKKEGITNTVIVVTRYFGGIKLGAGGLIRAYTKGAKIAIDSGVIQNHIVSNPMELEVDYNFIGKINNILEKDEIPCTSPIFMEKVKYKMYFNDDQLNRYDLLFNEITSGSANVKILPQEYLIYENDKPIIQE